MQTMTLTLPEAAPEWIERLVPQTCPAHPGTDLSSHGTCAICELHTQIAVHGTSPWVRHAMAGTLPGKSYDRFRP